MLAALRFAIHSALGLRTSCKSLPFAPFVPLPDIDFNRPSLESDLEIIRRISVLPWEGRGNKMRKKESLVTGRESLCKVVITTIAGANPDGGKQCCRG